MFIPVDFEVFTEACEDRRAIFCGDNLPDCVFYFYMDEIKKNGGCKNPANNNPFIIVDNIYINGNWGEISEYQYSGESDFDFEKRIANEGGAVFREAGFVVGFSPVMFDIIYRR